ncbi:nucleoside triphosphate pyrophosphatase [Selenomonas sp. F0473]|uniref:Maf family protein n=1 Tax=Selenomonas sp. F0473 TaxID=999423 RepID=UPI00029E3F36|nr:Maf family protein [Selenomonas sp. F0473]EKU70983.1 septum formation protein Maf [Selenomonas sp. F0473]
MFILASASPRRRDLLRQIGARFAAVASGAEESLREAPPRDAVVHNALAKAEAVAAAYPEHAVLGADTAVVIAGNVFGKPKNPADARHIIELLAGRRHEVCTGVAWIYRGRAYTDVAVTAVQFAPMSAAEIARYIATGEPMGKAGGYAIQGRAAMYIEEIHGSYSNVVGLPLQAVAALAREAGISLFEDDAAP